MDTTIIKTSQALEAPVLGLNKLIVNFPEGAKLLNGTSQGLITLKRDDADSPLVVHVKTVGGKLLRVSNVDDLDSYIVNTYVDQYGGTVREYKLTYSASTPSSTVHAAAGVKRIEVLDMDTLGASWYGGDSWASRIGDEGAIDLMSYVFLDTDKLVCKGVNSYGDTSYFKDKKDYVTINLLGTKITGNINAFKKCAANKLTLMYFNHCEGLYGELSELLDEMATREDVKGQTYTGWGFGSTSVTYKGTIINNNNVSIVFDNEGNYTVSW